MRISDWSSDVCSSDLPARRAGAARRLDGADDAFLAGALRRSRQSAGKDGSMTETDTRTVVVEREFAHPPAKVWRALTQPHLVDEWMMAGDVAPRLGDRLDFGADWGPVGCEVVAEEPESKLAYSWDGQGRGSHRTWHATTTTKT